jgi:hypothetical protein
MGASLKPRKAARKPQKIGPERQNVEARQTRRLKVKSNGRGEERKRKSDAANNNATRDSPRPKIRMEVYRTRSTRKGSDQDRHGRDDSGYQRGMKQNGRDKTKRKTVNVPSNKAMSLGTRGAMSCGGRALVGSHAERHASAAGRAAGSCSCEPGRTAATEERISGAAARREACSAFLQ